jgi:O-antigen ligase
LFFPLIADNHLVAWQSFGEQWVRGLLAMFAGAGVAAVFRDKNSAASFYLGLASAVSLFVHLFLFCVRAWNTSSMPWGYWGRETHHADLGYAAAHAVILILAAGVTGNRKVRFGAIVVIAAALLSTTLAQSRSGLAFAVFAGVLAFAAAYLGNQAVQVRRHILMGIGGLLLVVAGIVTVAVKEDPRWGRISNVGSELSAGFYGDALRLQCEGVASITDIVNAKYGDDAPRILKSVQSSDATRVVSLRSGLTLALKHPWGSDGSRQAFEKLLKQECANPAIRMAHTHDGWLDMALALGWVGAALYMSVLCYFLWLGVAYPRDNKTQNQWVVVLIALSIFWIFRGFTDSVFRDHMLEMQGFVLAYAAMALRLQGHDPNAGNRSDLA